MKRIWILIPLILLTGCLEKDITKLDVEMINDQGEFYRKSYNTRDVKWSKNEV